MSSSSLKGKMKRKYKYWLVLCPTHKPICPFWGLQFLFLFGCCRPKTNNVLTATRANYTVTLHSVHYCISVYGLRQTELNTVHSITTVCALRSCSLHSICLRSASRLKKIYRWLFYGDDTVEILAADNKLGYTMYGLDGHLSIFLTPEVYYCSHVTVSVRFLTTHKKKTH